MLGVQRTWISSVASPLQNAGLLRYSRGRLRITDRAALERKACGCYDSVRQLYAEALPMEVVAA
jgi:hypothetical protein